MADDADRAGEVIERFEAAAIAAIPTTLKTVLPVGRCYYCAKEVEDDLTFCDRDCRDDWEHEQRRRKELGL